MHSAVANAREFEQTASLSAGRFHFLYCFWNRRWLRMPFAKFGKRRVTKALGPRHHTKQPLNLRLPVSKTRTDRKQSFMHLASCRESFPVKVSHEAYWYG